MYYGVPGKHARMLRLYGGFLAPGELGVDVGAHVGNRVRAWRALGARVVAVEPQPDCLRLLRTLYGRDQGVILEPCALGAAPGTSRLHVSTRTPTVSSMSPTWVDQMERSPIFRGVRWDGAVDVAVTTLDALIARHGVPVFCKVDVEGYEVEVLAGLSQPLRALSFEYLPPTHAHALAAVARLEALGAPVGGYEFNYSPIETMRFVSDTWWDRAGLVTELEKRRVLPRSGDVYARLRNLA